MFNWFIKWVPITWILTNIMFFLILKHYGGFNLPSIHTIVLSIIPIIIINVIHRCFRLLKHLCATTQTFISYEMFEGMKRLKSKRNIIPIIVVYCFYAYCIYKLGFIPNNPLGVFGAFLASIALLCGLGGYCLYLHFIYIIFRISNYYDCDNQPYPQYQNWYSQIYYIYRSLSNTFSICGVLYILEYCMLMPKQLLIKVNNKYILNICDINLFYGSWISIFLLIVIAYPLLITIGNNLFNKLCSKWVNTKIQHIEENTLSKLQDTTQQISIDRTKEIFKVNTYYIKFYKTLYKKNKGIPIMISLTTIFNICINLCTFINQLLDVLSKCPS